MDGVDEPSNSGGWQSQIAADGSPVLTLPSKVPPEAVPALCDQVRSLLNQAGTDHVTCDLQLLEYAGLASIDLLFRLQLTARRSGGYVQLQNTPRRIQQLIQQTGLGDTLR
jgi:anti-anti-sigma factor